MTEEKKDTTTPRKKATRKRKATTKRTTTVTEPADDADSAAETAKTHAKQLSLADVRRVAPASAAKPAEKKRPAPRTRRKSKAPATEAQPTAPHHTVPTVEAFAVQEAAAEPAAPVVAEAPWAVPGGGAGSTDGDSSRAPLDLPAPSIDVPRPERRAPVEDSPEPAAPRPDTPQRYEPADRETNGSTRVGEAPPRGKRRRRRRRGGEGRSAAPRDHATGAAPSTRSAAAAPAPGTPRARTPIGDDRGRASEPHRDRPPVRPIDRTPETHRPPRPIAPMPQVKPAVTNDRTLSKEEDRNDRPPTAPRPVSKFVLRPTVPPGQSLRELLINISAGDECRIAVMQDGRLEELFIERAASQSHVGNIYKGRVTNIEPSIQAAFVDFGLQQNGFLHISDVQPQYFPDHKGASEEVGRKIPRMHRPPIQNCFRRGQEVIVQVTKEGVGTKGPTLTTYLSIPGRYLVMMPGMSRHGVSRKIEDDVERRTMRDLLKELNLPSGMGFILRTAGMGRTKREVQRDLNYLTRLWKIVADRIKSQPAPAELYQESDLVTRTIRDVYTTDFHRIVVDSAETAQKIRDFLEIALPRTKVAIDLYAEREPLFHRFRLEEEIERINMRHVPLPSGGSLVIDSTEALVAIDVNSGRSRVSDDAEEMAYRINMEAAEEIARQLRLRDLGGLIICDFIDMRADRHKRGVERCLKDALKKHKERARILRMSAFGLIEMTRQRQGPSMKRNLFFDCPHCKGSGLVKMPDSVILDVMRIIQLAVNHNLVQRMTVTVSSQVAYQILNHRRAALAAIEAETDKQIVVRGDPAFTSDQVEYSCEDSRGQPVNVLPTPPPVRPGRGR